MAFLENLPAPEEFYQYERLARELVAVHAAKPDFRGIVFAEQRIATHVLHHFISSTPRLASRFRPVVV